MNLNIKKVFLIVLDSFGIGGALDAHKFNDEGSNTFKSIASSNLFDTPNLKDLGLFNINNINIKNIKNNSITGSYARLREASNGKDTTIGHWEISGVISHKPLPTYPSGFPDHILQEFTRQTGKNVLCNRPYSGTDVIRDFGEQHLLTKALIVYTSADSVFQIAAHDDIVPIGELYKYCEIARSILTGDDAVGRVIARPFTGEFPFVRTSNRHDYSLLPPTPNMLSILQDNNFDTIGVGKISDIFSGVGISKSYPTKNNDEGMKVALDLLSLDFNGLAFINLVDFDMLYGHRNDVDGYARAMTSFDKQLEVFISNMSKHDILIITADHGCDPAFHTTDHTREDVPLLVYGDCVKADNNLGTRETFADIGKTILDIFLNNNNLKNNLNLISGTSFLSDIIKQ